MNTGQWLSLIVSVVIVLIWAVILYRFYVYYKEGNREPDARILAGPLGGIIHFHWLVEDPAASRWSHYKIRRMISLLAKYGEGKITVPGGHVWKTETVYEALHKANPAFKLVVAPGPSYTHRHLEVSGHTSYDGVCVAHRDNIEDSALVHELIHYVDLRMWGHKDPNHTMWSDRSEVERQVREEMQRYPFVNK